MQKLGPIVAAALLFGCADTDAALIAQAKEQVRRELLDPSSAQFRDLQVVEQVTGAKAVCGEVNAKNRMGGYVGFRDFLFLDGAVEIAPEDGPLPSGEVAAYEAAGEAYAWIARSIKVCMLNGEEPKKAAGSP